MRRPTDLDAPRVVLVALVVAVLLTVVVATSTSTTAFSAYNVAWDGTSSLQSLTDEVGTHSRVVVDTPSYASVDPTTSLVLVLSPDSAYGPADSQRLRRFVESGGTLVVAEDFGPHGNELLAAVGAQARFDGRLLRDEERFYRSPNLPVAANASNTFVTTQSTTLTLNHGTAVRPNGATIAVTSSEFAYLDTGLPDQFDGEPIRPYPVVTVEQVGQGHVVAVGDPSVFINSMINRPGNRAFAEFLFAPYETALLDYSHSARPPPLAVVGYVVRETPALQAGLSLLGMAALYAWLSRPAWLGRLPFVRLPTEVSSGDRRRDDQAAPLARARAAFDRHLPRDMTLDTTTETREDRTDD